MKNKITKIVSVTLAVIMLSQTAFAMSDYKNIYNIDYMDEIFRFDTGDLLEGIEIQEEQNNPYEFYMEVLKSFGVNLYDEKGKRTPESNAEYSDLYGAIASLILSNSDFSESYKSGKFNGNVTMFEALGIMEDMLGYSKLKEELGIENIALEEKLLKGISYSKEKYISVGELALMLWNTLNAKGVAIKYTSNGLAYEEADKPLLERQLNVYEISGFLNAANGMNVYKNSSPNKGYVEIDRAGYLDGTSNAAEFLGHRVTAYVQGEIDEEKKILYIAEERNSENITLDINEIYSVDEYLEYEKDSKIKRIDIGNLEYILLNGNAVNDVSIIKDYEDLDGEITLSKTEKNGEYNVAIINAYEYFVVYAVDTYEGKIHLKDMAEFNGESFIEIPEDEIVFCTLDGEQVPYESLYSGCSIKVLQNDNKTYTRIDASTDTVTGKITDIDRDDDTVKINGEEYRVSKTYQNNEKNPAVSMNDYGVFYVTKDKYIAGFKYGNEASYAYLRKVLMDEDTEKYFVTIFTQMGKWETLELKEKITLDGVNVQDFEAYDTINNSGVEDELIRYKINASNKITFIDTMRDEPTEKNDNKRLLAGPEGEVTQSWQGGRWFRGDPGYRILDDSPVFVLPKDLDKTDDYRVKTGANLNNDEKKIYIKLYNKDAIGICEVAIVSQQAETIGEDTTYWFYCEKADLEWNDENQECEYVMTGTRVTSGKMDCIEDFKVKVSLEKKQKLEDTYPGAIAKGSFMKITYDTDGYLSAAELAFTNATLPNEFYTSKGGEYYQYFCGEVREVDPERGYILVKIKAADEESEFPLNKILCIDKSDYSTRTISIGELLKGEQMYVYKSGGWGRICVIVR